MAPAVPSAGATVLSRPADRERSALRPGRRVHLTGSGTRVHDVVPAPRERETGTMPIDQPRRTVAEDRPPRTLTAFTLTVSASPLVTRSVTFCALPPSR